MTGVNLQPRVEEQRDSDWRSISEALDQFYAGDFRHIAVKIREIFADSWQGRIRRDVKFVESYARELIPHYNVPPQRVFTGSGAGELAAAYDRYGIAQTIHAAAVKLAAQQTLLCLWLPQWDTAEIGWSVHTLSPWRTEVHPHPSAPSDISVARAIRVQLPRDTRFDRTVYDVAEFVRPIAGDDLRGIPLSGRARELLSQGRSVAIWATDGEPVFRMSPELPLGEYPIAVGRIGEPTGGDFYAPLPRWLYDAQINVSLSDSDMEFRGRYSGGQLVLYGQNQKMADTLPFGPDKLLGIERTDEGTKLENVPRTVDAQALISIMDSYTSRLRQSSGLRPESYSGHAVTADAKLIEGWVQQMLRADIQPALVEFERSMARAGSIAIGWRFGSGSAPLDIQSVQVRYSLPKPPRNDMQMAQAMQTRAGMGVEDVAQVVADESSERGEPMTREEAVAVVLRNRALFAEVSGGQASP